MIIAALVILQTRVRIARSKAGKWEVEIKKGAASRQMVKPLVEKMLSYIPDGAVQRVRRFGFHAEAQRRREDTHYFCLSSSSFL